MPVIPVTQTQPTTGVQPTRRPLSQVAPAADRQIRMAADAYIASPLTRITDEGLAFGATTMQVLNATATVQGGTGVGKPVTDYGNPLKSATAQAKNSAISSAIRNGVMVAMKKEDVAQAAGNVVADVATNTGRAAISSLATNGAVFALAKAGAGSFPIVAGGMIVGMGASYATGKILKKTGVRTAIATKTTEAVRKVTHH